MTDSTRRARSPAQPAAPQPRDPVLDHDDTDLARERFRRATRRGDYLGLLDPNVWHLFAEAATQRGFETEIGALRFALARLVAEETDPRQLATHLARVTTTILRAAEAHERAQAEPEDPIATALTRVLTDLSDPSGPRHEPVVRPRSRRAQEIRDDRSFEDPRDPDFDDPDADGDWPGDDL